MNTTSSNGYSYQIDDQDIHFTHGRSWCVHKPKQGRYKYVVNVISLHGKSKMVYLHRLISGAKQGEIVDHINGDTLDNRRCNLRVGTQRLNQGNQRRVRGVVPFKGVSLENGRFRARIRSNGKKISLGNFRTAEEAGMAYREAAKKEFGEFAYSNAS
jgi:hypothetical protein